MGSSQIFVFVYILLCTVAACSFAFELDTNLGHFIGRESESSFGFDGIPYAVPPVGPRRWTKPEANDFMFTPDFHANYSLPGPACPQEVSVLSKVFPQGYSEDCLSLNIEIPKNAYNERTKSFEGSDLPVMIFIHGGGYVIGMGKEFYVRSEEFSKRDVIFVTVNYRLGVFGFLSLPELRKEDPSAFNFGLLDQRLAIRWVQKNIHYFGGDSKKITLFGESAGAMSILWQLTALDEDLPEDQALSTLRGAIIQSPADVPIVPCSESDKTFQTVMEHLIPKDGPVMETLRTLDTQTLMDAIPTFPQTRKLFFHTMTPYTASIMPCTGEKVFTKSYRDSIAARKFNSNPNFIIGTTHDEGNLFSFLVFMFYSNLDAPTLSTMVGSAFPHGSDAERLLSFYNSQHDNTTDVILSSILNDGYFQVGAHNVANKLAEYQPKTYRYVFNHTSQHAELDLKAFHGSELAYLFHLSEGGMSPALFSPEEHELSMTMIDYWTNFAKTGQPSAPHLPTWPVYSKSEPFTQSLSVPIETLPSYKEETTALWNDIYPKGLPFMGELDELIHESVLSSTINKGLFYAIARPKTALVIVCATILSMLYFPLKFCCKNRKKTKVE